MASKFQKFECCTTKTIEQSSFVIEWKVHREVVDSLFKEEDGSRKSATFNSNFYESSWQLFLDHKLPNDLSLYFLLEKASLDLNQIWAKINLKLKAITTPVTTDYEREVEQWHNDMEFGVGFDQWISKDELYKDKYWTDDFMTIEVVAQVKVLGSEATSTTVPIAPKVVENGVEEKYSRLFQTGIFSDVTLCVADQKFKAHRSILAVSCNYFDAMFQGNFQESLEPVVVINDMDPEIFEIVLKYIYTNQLSNDLGSKAKEVLAAAHRFGLEAVVDKCEVQLCRNTNLSNFAQLLIFADSFDQKRLKETITAFVKNNLKEVIQSETWKEFKISHLKLAHEIFEAAVV